MTRRSLPTPSARSICWTGWWQKSSITGRATLNQQRSRCNMKPSEAMRIAWEAILKNKVRSFLTMLGIIIGVSAVIIMIAISAGTEATISDQITSLGSNLVFVQSAMVRPGPGQAAASGLVYEDAAAIQDGV